MFQLKNLNFTTEITLYYATYIQTIEYYVIVEGGKREPIAKRTKGTNQPSTGVALSLYYTVFQITWCHGKYFVPTKKPVTREN